MTDLPRKCYIFCWAHRNGSVGNCTVWRESYHAALAAAVANGYYEPRWWHRVVRALGVRGFDSGYRVYERAQS